MTHIDNALLVPMTRGEYWKAYHLLKATSGETKMGLMTKELGFDPEKVTARMWREYPKSATKDDKDTGYLLLMSIEGALFKLFDAHSKSIKQVFHNHTDQKLIATSWIASHHANTALKAIETEQLRNLND